MLHPPSITLRVQRDAVWRGAVFAVGALAGGVLAVWTQAWWAWPATALWVSVPVSMVSGGMLAGRMVPSTQGTLRWDGEVWWWRADPKAASTRSSADVKSYFAEGSLHVKIDAQGWLLTQFLPASVPGLRVAPAWIALSRGDLQAQWHPLRATLYSRAAQTPLRRSVDDDAKES